MSDGSKKLKMNRLNQRKTEARGENETEITLKLTHRIEEYEPTTTVSKIFPRHSQDQ